MPSSERLRLLDEIIYEWAVSSWIQAVKMPVLVIPSIFNPGWVGKKMGTAHDL